MITTNKSVTYSIRMDTSLKTRLEKEAQKVDRPVSYLVNNLLEDFLDRQEEKRKMLLERLKDLDEQKFIPGDVVMKKLREWSKGKKVDWSVLP